MKKFTKILAAVLAVLISAGATTAYAYATGDSDKEDTKIVAQPEENEASERPESSAAAEKDETVYVLSEADGAVNKIIVSDWLKNAGALESISDISSLTDIENVKGNEAFTQDGENVSWTASGADIYYRGTSDKELPLTIKVSYFLDGNEIEPAELAGKSGHVKIHFDYINNTASTVKIDGKDTEIYVPFIAATGTILNNSKFLNIEVSNGKVISDGDKSVILGYALSGVSESLGVKDEDVGIPESFEIEADVTDFELAETFSFALNPNFNLGDAQVETGEIATTIEKAISAVKQLSSGSEALYNGLNELLTKSSELISGVDTLYSGAGKLENGAAQLLQGEKTLNAGISTAKTGADALVAGQGQLKTGAEQLAGGLSKAAQSLDTTIAANKQVLAGLQAMYQQTGSNDIKTMIGALEQTIAGQEQIAASMKDGGALKAGADKLSAGISQSASGAAQLSGGLDALKSGSDELLNGASSLNAGAVQLKNGLLSLKDGSAALISGITQLKNGAGELKDGISKFTNEAAGIITNLFGGNMDALIERLDAIKDASASYNSFSGAAEGMNSSVKFVFTTKAIEK